ncbi:MAG: hypothetical protein D3909_06965, partial [Candidatus Electrothrix sp. ATG1]|nr:hypothetical protein [Candidatus Electrothrix sp. ATG1]
MPIRASAIRGQLRYWWRFLQSNRTDGKALSGEDLFKAERDIWGGMAEEGKDFSSKVKLRVKIEKNILLRFQGQQKRQYADDEPKYALFPAREQTQTIPHQSAKYLIWPDTKNQT